MACKGPKGRILSDAYARPSDLILKSHELVFADAALRADPVIRQILERSARLDAIFRVALGRVVYVSTRSTFVFLHSANPLILCRLLFIPHVSILFRGPIATRYRFTPSPNDGGHFCAHGTSHFYLLGLVSIKSGRM